MWYAVLRLYLLYLAQQYEKHLFLLVFCYIYKLTALTTDEITSLFYLQEEEDISEYILCISRFVFSCMHTEFSLV